MIQQNRDQLLHQLSAILRVEPSMVFKAPGRINIIGEHTDYNSGLCLPAAIDLGVYFAIAPASETIIHSLNQNNSWSPGQVSHCPDWTVYFKGVMELLKSKGFSWPYFKLAFGGDLPIGSGLSSSSALSCGFVAILDEWAGWNFDLESLCQIAIESERACGLEGGTMDQISIFNGKEDHALLINCADETFQYVPVKLENYSWLIADTKVKHKLVDSEYNSRSRKCKEILAKSKTVYAEISSLSKLQLDQLKNLNKVLNPSEFDIINYILSENERVRRFCKYLEEEKIIEAGTVLFEGHDGLRLSYKVSCPELDFLVSFARHHSAAIGARMMGGGFGGSSLHLVLNDRYEEYNTAVSHAYLNRFGFRPFIHKVNINKGISRIC